MEELKQTIISYWPMILEYAFMALVYVLVFLYRSKVKGSHNTVTALFKEQTQEQIKSNDTLRTDMSKELAASKKAYQDAIDKINSLEEKADRLERVLSAFLIEEEVETDAELYKDESN